MGVIVNSCKIYLQPLTCFFFPHCHFIPLFIVLSPILPYRNDPDHFSTVCSQIGAADFSPSPAGWPGAGRLLASLATQGQSMAVQSPAPLNQVVATQPFCYPLISSGYWVQDAGVSG